MFQLATDFFFKKNRLEKASDDIWTIIRVVLLCKLESTLWVFDL